MSHSVPGILDHGVFHVTEAARLQRQVGTYVRQKVLRERRVAAEIVATLRRQLEERCGERALHPRGKWVEGVIRCEDCRITDTTTTGLP